MRQWTIVLAAFIAEALTITWRWGHSPTDGLRVWYGSFREYFIDSISPWLVIFAVLVSAWVLIAKLVTRRKQEV